MSLRDIRKRIKGVKNTQKITKAMKMVSAAKLRRAQENVEAARPYAEKVQQTVSALAKRAEALGEPPHPLLGRGHDAGKVELIVMTSNRGLCGGFNSNTVRRAQRFLVDNRQKYSAITVATIGKKGFELCRARGVPVRENFANLLSGASFSAADEMAKTYCQKFIDGELDAVYLLYNEFRGELRLKQLLPVVSVETEDHLAEHEYEPSRAELLNRLLPRHFAMQLFRALLETIAAEHMARMTAMDSATSNAADVVARLTLQYNRARQASITTELMEIISGAEALK